MDQDTITALLDTLIQRIERVQQLVRLEASPHSILWPIHAEPRRAPNTPRAPRLAIEPEALTGEHIGAALAQAIGQLHYHPERDPTGVDRFPGVLLMPGHTREAFEALNQAKTRFLDACLAVPERQRRSTLKHWLPKAFSRLYATRQLHLAGPDTLQVHFSWRRAQSKWESLEDRQDAQRWFEHHAPVTTTQETWAEIRENLRGLPANARLVVRHPRPPEPFVRWSIEDPEHPNRKKRIGESRASLPLVVFDALPAIKPLQPTAGEDAGWRDNYGYRVRVHSRASQNYEPIHPHFNVYHVRGGTTEVNA